VLTPHAQREMQARISGIAPSLDNDLRIDSELIWIKTFVDRWTSRWCVGDDDRLRHWHLRHDALTVKLLLSIRCLGKKTSAGDKVHVQDDILETAEAIFDEALRHSGPPPVSIKSGPFTFAASIILKLGVGYDKVLRLALQMAGDPESRGLATHSRLNGYQMLGMLAEVK
jgi:hypothetical protein